MMLSKSATPLGILFTEPSIHAPYLAWIRI
jgi:hypothetical protein